MESAWTRNIIWSFNAVKRVRIRPGFFLLLAVLFYLDEGMGVLPWGLGAAALHECGHYCAAHFFGGQLRQLELSAVGAQMELRYRAPLSYFREIAITLAGPLVNLLLGWMGARLNWFLFAAANLGLAGFNLLPILPLDGGRVLWCAVVCLVGEEWGERVLAISGGVLVGVLVGVGAIAALHYANVSLLIVSVWLFWMIIRRKK